MFWLVVGFEEPERWFRRSTVFSVWRKHNAWRFQVSTAHVLNLGLFRFVGGTLKVITECFWGACWLQHGLWSTLDHCEGCYWSVLKMYWRLVLFAWTMEIIIKGYWGVSLTAVRSRAVYGRNWSKLASIWRSLQMMYSNLVLKSWLLKFRADFLALVRSPFARTLLRGS